MDREEVLSRARAAKMDEGLVQAEQKGRRVGVIAFCLVFIGLTIFNLVVGRDNDALGAMFLAYIAAEAYPKYRFTGEKGYLVTVVCFAIAAVCFLACYVIECVR